MMVKRLDYSLVWFNNCIIMIVTYTYNVFYDYTIIHVVSSYMHFDD